MRMIKLEEMPIDHSQYVFDKDIDLVLSYNKK